jgi:hypothetical protein
MAFPAWQSAGYGAATPWAASSGTSKTILVPSGATAGHLGIIVVATNGGASNNHSIAGWTRKYQTTLLSWGDTYVMTSIHWKKLVGGDINANATITLGAALRGGASVHTFANAEVDSDPFVDLQFSESSSGAQPVTLTCSTAGIAESALFTVLEKDTVTITTTPPTGFTRRHDPGTANEAGHVAVKESVGAGSNAHAWTMSTTNRNNEILVAIKAAAAAPTGDRIFVQPPRRH